VLLVEDEDGVREVLDEALQQLGYRTVVAASAESALEKLEAVAPDLVLTDVSMPGMSGIDLCRQLKSDPRFQFVPIVILTAVADLPSRVRGLAAGADDFFPKPFELPELRARLASLVRIKRLHDELEERNALLRTVLGRYVSEAVAAEIIANPGRHLTPGGVKREVTVLFADLRGFTPLSESLDPGKVVEILNAYLAVAVEAVLQFGGTIDKFLGDGVMALFGAPVAHDDDPERAVRAALRIQDALRELVLPGFHGTRLQIGIGINTGVVIAGAVGTDQRMDYTVIGGDVNVAQRLEAAAGPGQLLISGATYDQVKTLVRVRDLGPLRVKGKTEGVLAYDVIGLA
jgi:adenylate cyclase